MEFERNTPKLNLTLYVPILILLALFLGSILIPSKLFDQNLGNSLTKKKALKRDELRIEFSRSENPKINKNFLVRTTSGDDVITTDKTSKTSTVIS